MEIQMLCALTWASAQRDFPSHSLMTVMTADGYPAYRHCNTGTHEIHAGGQVTSIDNHWVVPYNCYLSGCYECHINVEVCISVHATKYIHKYIFKGHDRITAVMQQDEIKQYLDARWLGDAEAMYCIFHFRTGVSFATQVVNKGISWPHNLDYSRPL